MSGTVLQLGQVALHLRYEKGRSLAWFGQLSEKIKEAQKRSRIHHRSSKLHLDCSDHLKKLGYAVVNEKNIDGLEVDISLEGLNSLIEVDGPSHFAAGTRKPLGHTLFKQRLLKAMGWNLVTIPYWEWNEQKGSDAKQEYLKDKLSCIQKN